MLVCLPQLHMFPFRYEIHQPKVRYLGALAGLTSVCMDEEPTLIFRCRHSAAEDGLSGCRRATSENSSYAGLEGSPLPSPLLILYFQTTSMFSGDITSEGSCTAS